MPQAASPLPRNDIFGRRWVQERTCTRARCGRLTVAGDARLRVSSWQPPELLRACHYPHTRGVPCRRPSCGRCPAAGAKVWLARLCLKTPTLARMRQRGTPVEALISCPSLARQANVSNAESSFETELVLGDCTPCPLPACLAGARVLIAHSRANLGSRQASWRGAGGECFSLAS